MSPKKEPTTKYQKGWYSITINPDDQHQFFGKDDRMTKFRNHVNANLLFLKGMHIDYHLYIELSEPMTNEKSKSGPRLHLHGIMRFRATMSIKQFLLNGFYKLTRWSMLDIDTIEDIEYWKKYCLKQQDIMKEEAIATDGSLWDQATSSLLPTDPKEESK